MGLLSVCIPTWNGRSLISRTLQSLLAQEGLEMEILIGDDASTDGTLEEIRKFSDSRITIHAFDKRVGMVSNWNRTLGMAKGDYLVLMGQDDEVDPRWGATLVGLLDSHPQADLAFCRRRFVFADEESRKDLGPFFEGTYREKLRLFYDNIDEVIAPETMVKESMRYEFEINLIGEPSFYVFRRNSPAVGGGFRESIGQMVDWEFVTRFFVDRPILHAARELGTYHLHASGESLDNYRNMIRHWRDYESLLELFKERFSAQLSPEMNGQILRRQQEQRDKIAEHLANHPPEGE